MKKPLFLIALILFIGFGCKKEKGVTQKYVYDVTMHFSIVNENNENLLDVNTPGHIDAEKVRLYFVIDGKPQMYFDHNMNAPYGTELVSDENGNSMIGILFNISPATEKPVTYIHWNETDVDTIEVLFQRRPTLTIKDKVWLNGDLIFNRADPEMDDSHYVLTK